MEETNHTLRLIRQEIGGKQAFTSPHPSHPQPSHSPLTPTRVPQTPVYNDAMTEEDLDEEHPQVRIFSEFSSRIFLENLQEIRHFDFTKIRVSRNLQKIHRNFRKDSQKFLIMYSK
jgi:hypothetical protein